MKRALRTVAVGVGLIAVCFFGPAKTQPVLSPANIAPIVGITTITSGTITLTDTFQSVLAASTNRRGCTIQNQSTHTMYAYFGPNGSATKAASLQVSAGQTLYCSFTQGVAADNVSLTGTTGDAFVVNSQ